MISVIAYYVVKNNVENHEELLKKQKDFLSSIDAKGRIYVGPQGVNAQLSLESKYLQDYVDFLKEDAFYDSADLKVHEDSMHAFDRLQIKYKKEIVALGEEVDFTQIAESLSPEQWDEKINQEDKNTIIIDARNNYEWEVGHFKGAMKPDLTTFRDFKKFADDLEKKYDKEKTTVMMYCTGGIRCEFFSPAMKKRGFKKMYQLDGGIIGYGLRSKGENWKGRLFVFDDRMSIPINPEKQEVISKCLFCGCSSDVFYNCANMDCNDLFISCNTCAKEHKGCCKSSCESAERVRPMSTQERPRPFRRLSQEKENFAKTMNV